MEVRRTPDDRFVDLPDYPFAPHYDTLGGDVRIHWVDEGPAAGPVVLLMHGQPSWSYLYRHMIPPLVAQGCRVLAPDLIGFGRSDKPANPADHSYERQVAWMLAWFDACGLRDVTLFCQDWGGLIGLRLVAARPASFAGVVVANTGLPEGHGMSEAFAHWLDFSQTVPVLPVGGVIQAATTRTLSDAEVAAYDAPFPDESYKAGPRRFPVLVPLTPEHASVAENRAAWAVLEAFDRPFVTAFSDADPITAGGEAVFQRRVPGVAGQPHAIIAGAGHFLQEDAPDALVAIIMDLVHRTGIADAIA